MRRHSSVEPRRVIFIGVEGESERAFVRFLERCCRDEDLHLSVNIKLTRGGDSVAVVEEAGRHLARRAARTEIESRLVLLDRDRIEGDRKAGRDAQTVAAKWDLQLVHQCPQHEGLLWRLHPGQEQRQVKARIALTELRRVWPEYSKPATADELRRRFSLSDLRRAARYDKELRRLLAVLGL